MKIALASDHAGFELKTEVLAYLRERGIDFKDFGCSPEEQADYIDYGIKAIESVAAGDCGRAILFCGTGLGMALVANKYKGIRATPCWSTYTAEVCRSHNNSNCLTLGGRVLSPEECLAIVETWLDTPFEGGRHEQRINKLSAIEQENFKP